MFNFNKTDYLHIGTFLVLFTTAIITGVVGGFGNLGSGVSAFLCLALFISFMDVAIYGLTGGYSE